MSKDEATHADKVKPEEKKKNTVGHKLSGKYSIMGHNYEPEHVREILFGDRRTNE